MTDQLDRARAIEMRQREAALQEALHTTPEPPQQIINGVVCCIDCDEPVSPQRLRAKPNAARCIHCQSQEEKSHGHR